MKLSFNKKVTNFRKEVKTMKNIFLIFLFFLLITNLTGCDINKQKENLNKNIDKNIKVEQEQNKNTKTIIISKNKDIFLEIPDKQITINNHVHIKGLTTLSNLKVEIIDENGHLLNENDKNIEIIKNENSWNSFNKYLYFFNKPTSNKGVIKIYSEKENFVQIPVIFENKLTNNKTIEIIYPTREMEQKGFIRILGYASVWEGTVNYRIKDINGNIINEGFIQATTAAPDVGIFAKDIKLDIDSGPIILEVFEKSAKDQKETNKITMKLNYIK